MFFRPSLLKEFKAGKIGHTKGKLMIKNSGGKL